MLSRRTTLRVLLGGAAAAMGASLSTACRTTGAPTPTAPVTTAAPAPVRVASLRTFAEAGQYIWRALQRAGLPPESVDTLDLGQDFQNVAAAIGNRAVDVATIPEPIATVAAEQGLATKWREVADLLPGLQVTVVLFGRDIAINRPAIGRRWMTAYLKGVRDYHEAIFRSGPHRDEVIATIAKWTGVTDQALYAKMGFPIIDPNGQISLDSLKDQLSFHREQGNVTVGLDVAQVVDTRFAEAAVQQLGVYRV